MSLKTAILYFALRPELEAKRKPIFAEHGAAANQRFYKTLQEELFSELTPLGLPMISADERHQVGKTFGERITHAISSVWEKGYDQVLIIGNDCPQLSAELLQQSIDLLSLGQSSLMRTHRGGVGLIAINKGVYRESIWSEVKWQSTGTFEDLFDCIGNCKVIGEDMHELNTLSDAYAYLELRRDDEVSYLIDILLNPLRHFVSLQSTEAERSKPATPKRRGPPFSC